jgi:type III restriction enzyme
MEFSLAGAPADLPDFTAQDDERPYLIDVVRGHVAISQEQPQYVLDLNAPTAILRREDLIRALDRRVRRDDVLQPDMIAWLGRVLDALEARGIELAYCARHANRLADCIIARIAGLSMHARARAFQGLLLEGPARARLSDFHTFRFAPDRYPARCLHQGRYQFAGHFYGAPGELDDSIEQEETACAIALDQMNDVRHWVRDLERQPVSSFWLPTASDRFYPDFVVQLEDGRLLVVEYKGAHLYGNPDSREKRDIGMLWAASSNGRCVFLMATHPSAAGGVAVPARLRAAISAS